MIQFCPEDFIEKIVEGKDIAGRYRDILASAIKEAMGKLSLQFMNDLN